LPPDLNEWVWREAERISRPFWARKPDFDEDWVEHEVQSVAKKLDTQLVERGIPRDEGMMNGFLDRIREIIGNPDTPVLQKVWQIVEEVFGLLRRMPPEERIRTEKPYYDLITVGTGLSNYSGQFFGSTLGNMINFRTRNISSNDYLELADRYLDDPEGFRKALGMDPMRTALMFTTQSGETFGTDLADKWDARVGREMFGTRWSR